MRSSTIRSVACGLAALAFASPVLATTPFVVKTAPWRSDIGYIAGSFSVTGSNNIWTVGVVDAAGREYPITFDGRAGYEAQRGLLSGSIDQGREPWIVVIEVPPGDYRIGYWIVQEKERRRKSVPRSHTLGQPFAVQPGHVVFLGKFQADSSIEARRRALYDMSFDRYEVWRLQAQELTADHAWELLARTYETFADAPVECLFCQAPSAGAARSAVAAVPQAGDFTARHEIRIHLHRRSGSYDDTGLVAWESLGMGRDRDVVGATRRNPMHWRSSDAFGVRWSLNDGNFKDGTVHLKLMDGRRELPDGKELTWAVADSHEAWIIEGDEKVYFSKAQALAALPPEEAQAVNDAEPKPATGPEVTIHYHHPGGGYRALSLEAWTRDAGGKRTLVAGTAGHGLRVTDFPDDFGPYWELRDSMFPDGMVSFSITGGPASRLEWTFSLSDAHEVWINPEDPTVYLRKDEAVEVQDD